ncbi:MAG: enoyl-CoA hydratase/isomerase family protein [Phycisphaerae bacterium]|nr:enoyl-CoA hydratase/isomerase family protein [Phycisphaerae bacterium]
MIGATIERGVATLTLRRAAKRNAMTPELLACLVTSIGQVSSGARAIVLAGEGTVFCAGFDLSLCREHPDGSVMRALLSGLSDVIVALRDQPRPVVMAAHGAAIAGGCALLGAADFVITNDDAKIGYPVARLGVSPAVSAPYLRLLVGDGAARERLLDSRLISGREAAGIGLATQSLASAADVGPAAQATARALANTPVEAISATRAWLHEVEGLGDAPWRALRASLALTGEEEERRMLPKAWTTRPTDSPN